jgi:predicted AAA+ superfamily ATPase
MREAIQVCYWLIDVETKKREIEGLLEAMETHGLNSGVILTYDDKEEDLSVAGKDLRVLPVWKWLII